MRPIFARAVAPLLTCAFAHAFAADTPPPVDSPASGTAVSAADGDIDEAPLPASPADAQFCIYPLSAPSAGTYTTVHKLKVGKGTYGSVSEMLPQLVAKARHEGADAIVDYDGAQRFGFWPWRMVHPVVHGTGVKWSGPAPDCAASGGTTLGAILASGKVPDPASSPTK